MVHGGSVRPRDTTHHSSFTQNQPTSVAMKAYTQAHWKHFIGTIGSAGVRNLVCLGFERFDNIAEHVRNAAHEYCSTYKT